MLNCRDTPSWTHGGKINRRTDTHTDGRTSSNPNTNVLTGLPKGFPPDATLSMPPYLGLGFSHTKLGILALHCIANFVFPYNCRLLLYFLINVKLDVTGYKIIAFQGCRLHQSCSFLMAQLKQICLNARFCTVELIFRGNQYNYITWKSYPVLFPFYRGRGMLIAETIFCISTFIKKKKHCAFK